MKKPRLPIIAALLLVLMPGSTVVADNASDVLVPDVDGPVMLEITADARELSAKFKRSTQELKARLNGLERSFAALF